MTKKLSLTKIELRTKDGKDVSLSIYEARELHEQLHELFGEKYTPCAPVVIYPERWRLRYLYTPVWYSSTNSYGASDGEICEIKGQSGLTVSYYGLPNSGN